MTDAASPAGAPGGTGSPHRAPSAPRITGPLRAVVTLVVILAFIALAILALNTSTITRTISLGAAAQPLATAPATNPATSPPAPPAGSPAPVTAPVAAAPVAAAPVAAVPVAAVSTAPAPAPSRPPASTRPVPPPSVPAGPPVAPAPACPIPVAAPTQTGGLQSLVGLIPAFGPFSAEAFAMAPAYAPVLNLLGPVLAQFPALQARAQPLVGPLLTAMQNGADTLYSLISPLYAPYRQQMIGYETKLAAAISPYAQKAAGTPMASCVIDLEGALVALTVPAKAGG